MSFDDPEAGGFEEEDLFVMEAGRVLGFIPGDAVARIKSKGLHIGTKGGQSLRKGGGISGQIRRRLGTVERRVNNLYERLDGGGGVARPGNPSGARTVAGSTLALGAPGASGFAPWGPLQVTPTNPLDVTYAVIELIEDAPGAPAAGAQPVNIPTPFIVTQLTVAGDNIIRSAAPAVPGSMFSPQASSYGFPLAAGRFVTIDAGSPAIFAGQWSPRSDNGQAAADVTAAVLARNIARG